VSPDSNKSAGARIAQRLLFSLVPLALLLLVGELAARFGACPVDDQERSFEHNEVYWVTDPDLQSKSFPHREVGGSFTVTTDPKGLRAPVHRLSKPDGIFRILTLGCSTTFGWGVDDELSYPAQLESRLRKRGYHKVQVINGGQPGYTSFQGLWLHRTVTRLYQPDLVVFGYVVQDARRAAYSDKSQAMLQQDARFLKQGLLYKSSLYLCLRTLIHARTIETKERAEGGEEGVFRVSREDYVQNLRQFKGMAEQDGARLMLFGFPLERAGYTSEHRRLLRIAAQELDLPHFDPQEEFEQLTRGSTLYFPQDRGHANAEGNTAIAQRLAHFLEEQGLLPPPGGSP